MDHVVDEGVSATEERASGYGRGARILSVGIATTGVVTFAYFSVASHVLDDDDYASISLLWSVLFITVSVIYRPVEQLLSRTIADRRARGLVHDHPLRTPLLIQAGFALAFAAVALALRGPIQDGLFDGSAALYWILFVAVLAYAASYFARGWLAGHQWFSLYGGLVFLEATSRLLFALAVAVGIAEGQTAVALGMAAAPFVSLVVVPLAFARHPRAGTRRSEDDELSVARGGRFAVAVLMIMLAEQTLLNGAVLTTDLTASDAAVAGFVFNVLLIARAPLQLFQAVQGSLLPHLAGLEARAGRAEARRAVRITVLAIAGFAVAVAVGLVAVGPCTGRARDGLPPDGGDAQPGGARARRGRPGGGRVVGGGRRLRRVAGGAAGRRRAAARRDRLPRGRGAAVRTSRGRAQAGGVMSAATWRTHSSTTPSRTRDT
jgi:O-antigen/teichoic acid export membrane protein